MAKTEIRMTVPDRQMAAKAAAWLERDGAQQVDVVSIDGIDPTLLPTIVTAVMVSAGSVSTFIVWLRRQTRCAMIIDARNDRLNITYDCKDRRGRTIIVCDENTRVNILDPGYLLDFGELAKIAVTKGAEAISAVAQGAKIEYSIERNSEEK